MITTNTHDGDFPELNKVKARLLENIQPLFPHPLQATVSYVRARRARQVPLTLNIA